MTTSLSASPIPIAATTPSIYHNRTAQLEIAKYPLSLRTVDISLRQHQTLPQLVKDNFEDIWEVRCIAERHLAEEGYSNRLCYAKFEAETPPIWEVTAYSSLPSSIDYPIVRKIYSICQQTKVLFRTFFLPTKLSESALEKEATFWSALEETPCLSGPKNGRGALTQAQVIHNQIVFPNTLSSDHDEILLLYNYAPLKTGGEQMHFLLIPNPNKPAENFLELDKQQYVNVLSMAQKIALWAEEVFNGQATVHFFDKTGEIAGQTQPLFHAHMIIVNKEKEEIWGRFSLFFRMLMPPSPLSTHELAKRVNDYRASLGKFLMEAR